MFDYNNSTDNQNNEQNGFENQNNGWKSQSEGEFNVADYNNEAPQKPQTVYTWHSGGLVVQPQEEISDYEALSVKPKSKNPGIAAMIAVGMLFSLICGAGGGFLAAKFFDDNSAAGNNQSVIYQSVPQTTNIGNSASGGDSLTISQIVELTQNSVVEITTETIQNGSRLRQYVSEGAGSGVIITADGYLVTNNHVIANANKITVRLKDSRTFEAKLIGTDAKTDLAVIKIEATGLQPVIMGDSSKLLVGETAVAVGNPLGQLGGTVTNGIISALDREIEIDGEKMTLMQTNAEINPGNSGGGLFNSRGELIGIVNAKSSGSDVEGLGFAIPVNSVKPVIEDLISVGYVKGRLDIGMSIVDINDAQTAMMYRVSDLGVYVYSVNNGSSALTAGFKQGDLVISINNEKISNYSDFNKELEKYEIGETVNVTVHRNGQDITLNLVLTEYVPGI